MRSSAASKDLSGRQPERQRTAVGAAAAAWTDGRPGRFERIAVPVIVVIYAVGMPVWSGSRVLDEPHRPIVAITVIVATVCSAVLQLWLLVPAARARRPRHAGWLIGTFIIINGAAFAVIGVLWFAAGEQLAVIAAVYLDLRWAVPAVVALAAAPAASAFAGHDPVAGRYFAQNTLYWAIAMGLLIYVARAAAELRARKRELAESAVIAERARIDAELGASIGAELEQLIPAGRRAEHAARDDPAAAEHDLRAVTSASRRALATTRRMVSHYQTITARSEVGTAVKLLAAAGIAARVEVPADVLSQVLDNQRLAKFRSQLTAALRDEAVCECVISARGSGSDLQLELRYRGRVPS
jgi:signal transduction histidine kinase